MAFRAQFTSIAPKGGEGEAKPRGSNTDIPDICLSDRPFTLTGPQPIWARREEPSYVQEQPDPGASTPLQPLSHARKGHQP